MFDNARDTSSQGSIYNMKQVRLIDCKDYSYETKHFHKLHDQEFYGALVLALTRALRARRARRA